MSGLSLLHTPGATGSTFFNTKENFGPRLGTYGDLKTPHAVRAEAVLQKRSPGKNQKHHAGQQAGRKAPASKQGPGFAPTAGIVVPLITDGKDVEYFVKVRLGTPAQEIYLEVDTGSGMTWTSGVGTGKQPSQMLHNYDYTKSSTFKHAGSQGFSMVYTDKTEVKGLMGSETMTLGGLVLRDQSLGVGRTIGDMARSKGNGLMGMSFVSPMVAALKRVLQTPVMTFHLVKDKGGELTLGAVDTRHLQGQITYAPVYKDGSGHWLLESTAIKINGQIIPRSARSASLPDTGSTTIYLPANLVRGIYKHVPGAFQDGGNWYIPANAKYPPVELKLGGQFYQIPSSQMYFSGLRQFDNSWLGAFQESADPSFPQDLIGTIFFKSYLVVFDIGNARIGLGRRSDVIYD